MANNDPSVLDHSQYTYEMGITGKNNIKLVRIHKGNRSLSIVPISELSNIAHIDVVSVSSPRDEQEVSRTGILPIDLSDKSIDIIEFLGVVVDITHHLPEQINKMMYFTNSVIKGRFNRTSHRMKVGVLHIDDTTCILDDPVGFPHFFSSVGCFSVGMHLSAMAIVKLYPANARTMYWHRSNSKQAENHTAYVLNQLMILHDDDMEKQRESGVPDAQLKHRYRCYATNMDPRQSISEMTDTINAYRLLRYPTLLLTKFKHRTDASKFISVPSSDEDFGEALQKLGYRPNAYFPKADRPLRRSVLDEQNTGRLLEYLQQMGYT